MTSKQSRKGSDFERDLAKYLSEQTGIQAGRMPLSGGGFVGLAGGADLLGTPGLFVEAKRVEKLSFPEAMRQAVENIRKTQSPEAPVVINRRSRQSIGESYTLLRLDDFLVFYRAWLAQEGFTKKDPTQ